MQETQLEHVLCVPLSFCRSSVDQGQPQCVFLCCCGQMQDQITAVKNLGTSSRPCYAGECSEVLHGVCSQSHN